MPVLLSLLSFRIFGQISLTSEPHLNLLLAISTSPAKVVCFGASMITVPSADLLLAKQSSIPSPPQLASLGYFGLTLAHARATLVCHP